MKKPKPIHPAEAHAIIDADGRLLEDSATGKLAIFYALEDAVFALPPIQRTFPKATVILVAIKASRTRLPVPLVGSAQRGAGH
jgi:hypothetical protein